MKSGSIGTVDNESEPIETVAQKYYPKTETKNNDYRLIITGSNDLAVAAVGLDQLRRGNQVVLLPNSLNYKSNNRFRLAAAKTVVLDDKVSVIENEQDWEDADWDLVCYSSGSTGDPRPIGIRRGQLQETVSWYQQIYDLTRESLIVSSLPSTYNYPFIAGAYTTSNIGCTYCVASGINQMIELITNPPASHDRVVALLNPVLLQKLGERNPDVDDKVLMDTGGAPMSRHAVQWFRNNVGDLREGYGLTETCSLTHFDREGSDESAGTVGRGLPGVETEIDSQEGKPIIHIDTENIGVELTDSGRPMSSWPETIETGDLGQIDTHGRLRVLGRSSDIQINGYWPKDTLDLIGPILGPKCAIVRHLSGKHVVIRLWQDVEAEIVHRIRTRVAEQLDTSLEDVTVETTEGRLLHSQKIPYESSDSAE